MMLLRPKIPTQVKTHIENMWRLLLKIQAPILLDHDTAPPKALASKTATGWHLVNWFVPWPKLKLVLARNGPQGCPHHSMPPFLTRRVSRILRRKPRTEQKSSCSRCMKSIHCLDLWNSLKIYFRVKWWHVDTYSCIMLVHIVEDWTICTPAFLSLQVLASIYVYLYIYIYIFTYINIYIYIIDGGRQPSLWSILGHDETQPSAGKILQRAHKSPSPGRSFWDGEKPSNKFTLTLRIEMTTMQIGSPTLCHEMPLQVKSPSATWHT